MKILFATTNKNKTIRIKNLLKGSDFEIISLSDLDYKIEEPEENGKDGVENAIIKAKYYYENLKVKMPVLTQDDTLFLSEVSDEDNPGKDIKSPVINKYGQFTDENAYIYYLDLIKKYSKKHLNLEFHYGHAICSDNFLEGSFSVLSGILCDKINEKKTPGYFLGDMLKVNVSNVWKYYSDLNESESIEQDKDLKRSINNLLKNYLDQI